jgi:hypothetical protein
MKRKYFSVGLFLIVFYLLCLLEVSCLANESPSPGEFWNTSSVEGKTLFVLGFQQGIAMCLFKLNLKITGILNKIEVWDELRDFDIFIGKDKQGIATLKVMDDLYKDPANTFIYNTDMIYIAYQKLRCEDIEALLQKAREEALSRHNK